MTTKKTFEAPTMEVVMLRQSDLIATSDFDLGFNPYDTDFTEENGMAD